MNGNTNLQNNSINYEGVPTVLYNNQNYNNINAKMKPCSVCGNFIAQNAKSCPYCGAKNKKKFYKKASFWVALSLVVIFIAANVGNLISDKLQENRYYEFVSYIKENGEYSDGVYRISMDVNRMLGSSATVYETSLCNICIDHNDMMFFEWITYSDTSDNYVRIDCDINSTLQNVKITNVYSSHSVNVTAKIEPGSYGKKKRLKNFYVDNAALGRENAESLATTQVNLTITYVSMFLEDLNCNINMQDLGYNDL